MAAIGSDEGPSKYTQEDVDNGLAISAAVLLHDPSRMQETMARIIEVSEREGLGLKVIDWQTASGIIGQFIVVLRVVLFVFIFIIFVVAIW